MERLIFPKEQWQMIIAGVYVIMSTLGLIAMVLGIIFTFAEIKPADRFLTSNGFSLMIGLGVGIFTTPSIFRKLVTIRGGSAGSAV